MTAADVSPVAGAGAAVVVGQGAGEDWLEVEAVGAVGSRLGLGTLVL